MPPRGYRYSTDRKSQVYGREFALARMRDRTVHTNETVFKINNGLTWPSTRQFYLKKMIHAGTYHCLLCEIEDQWNGNFIVLQVDHINGDKKDNRLENLRLLCPNCHSQTESFGGANAKRVKNRGRRPYADYHRKWSPDTDSKT